MATSLDNRMGAGGFELPPSCFPSLKKKKALKQMYENINIFTYSVGVLSSWMSTVTSVLFCL